MSRKFIAQRLQEALLKLTLRTLLKVVVPWEEAEESI
jgi:hypothetical protein